MRGFLLKPHSKVQAPVVQKVDIALKKIHQIYLYQLDCTLLVFIERFSLDCRKTKTKVNTLGNQRA